MAPAASVRVGEMSSKSRLPPQILISSIYIVLDKQIQKWDRWMERYRRNLPRGSWMDPEGRQSSILGRSKSISELDVLSLLILLALFRIDLLLPPFGGLVLAYYGQRERKGRLVVWLKKLRKWFNFLHSRNSKVSLTNVINLNHSQFRLK